MIKKLRKMLGLCDHEYKTVEVFTNSSRGIPIGRIYYQECQKCRKIRKYIL